MSDCNSEAVVAQLETIATLRNLRKKAEEGKVSIPVTIIDDELEAQRAQMEVTVSECGSLEGIPDQLLDDPNFQLEELPAEV